MNRVLHIFIKHHLLLQFFLFSSVIHLTKAQDIHFSQYYNAPLNLNPSLAGFFSEDIRFIANSKHQWGAVPVNYLTFSGSYDQKLSYKKMRNGFFTRGGIFNFDHAGDSKMSLLQLATNFSYIKRIGELNLIGIGAQLGIRSRYFDDRNLTFDKQFLGEAYSPRASTGENFNNRSTLILDFGVGLNYRMQMKDRRSHLDFGAAFYHPQEPSVKFLTENDVTLRSRKVFYVMTNFKISKKIDIVTNVGGQTQGAYNAFFVSNLYKYYLVEGKNKRRVVQLGLTYRFAEREDAFIPTIEFMTERYRLGLNYDVTISPFNVANNGRGGPEVSFQYLITTVKAVKSSKACPIF